MLKNVAGRVKMKDAKKLAVLAVLAFALVVPVSANQKSPNIKAQMGRGGSLEVTETTNSYVKSRVEEMKTMKADEKRAATQDVLERVRQRVEAMIQNSIRRYEKVQTQVRAAEGLSDTEKASIESRISAQIEAMNALQGQVKEANTVEELRQVMAQVKTRFRLSLGVMRQSVSGVFEDRLSNVLTKITDVYDRLSARVAALPDGEQKENLSAVLVEAQALLTEAKTNIEADEFVTAKQNLIDAKENLKEVAGGLNE